jgi:hypothetical protein
MGRGIEVQPEAAGVWGWGGSQAGGQGVPHSCFPAPSLQPVSTSGGGGMRCLRAAPSLSPQAGKSGLLCTEGDLVLEGRWREGPHQGSAQDSRTLG